MNNFFFNCSIEFHEISAAVLSHIKKQDKKWISSYGIDVCLIDRNFFKQFSKLDYLMTLFNCHEHSVFRFLPNTCYGWHKDNPGRSYALNMQLEGINSYTFIGDPLIENNKDYTDVKKINYEINKFVLINVRKFHTIINLNNIRYVLSISFPPKLVGKFEDIKDFLIKNNF